MKEEFEAPAVSLEADDLLQKAEKRAGTSDWGDYNFKEALNVLLACMDQEAQLSHMGRYLNWRNITRLLTNRLLIEKEKKKLDRPRGGSSGEYIFITGLPRTGTSLLHNLMIQDPNAHYIRMCDGMYPAPPPMPETWHDAPRIENTEKYVTTLYRYRPDLKKVHYVTPTGPEECLFLFEHQFIDTIFSIRMNIPTYDGWLFSHNHDASYADYHHMLDLLGTHFPRQRWVLKAPRHLFFLDSLLNEFPKAHVIWTHRDPMKVIPSFASLSYLFRLSFSDATDPKQTGETQFRNLATGLKRAMSFRQQTSDNRFYDLSYRDLMADPIETVRKVYDFFNLPFSGETEKAMKTWLVENPQNKHGKHQYSPEEFSLSDNRIRKEFSDYCHRFSIPKESD